MITQGNVKVNSYELLQKVVSNIKTPNLKHQITNKFQYSMTKTSTAVVSRHYLNPDLLVKMPLVQISKYHLFDILNLDNWDLFEI